MTFKNKISSSEMVKMLDSVKKRIDSIKKKARPLIKNEIELLTQNRNFSTDWRKIKISGIIHFDNIRNVTLIGDVIICSNNGKQKFDEIALPPGIYCSTIQDSIIDENVLIKDVKLLKNYYIGKNALLINNGMIMSDKNPVYGNGIEISVGIETGGRDIASYSELTVEEAEKLALSRDNKALLKEYNTFIKEYLREIKFEKAIISDSARVLNNNEINNSLIGNCSEVSGITLIKNSTVLSNKDEVTQLRDGAYVSNSIIQWGCKVVSMGIVSDSVLTEHSYVERHGKVTDSIIGPNTGIGEGEVTASLLGPFVGFHHQALLIAAIWPEGKGNIGYGANIGSNHTSRAPDQEVFPGEGMFFGLGVNIKFPSNFQKAPYTIIATDVRTLPQKIEFPFSLIRSSIKHVKEISSLLNEIIPAWVLSDNIYFIKRNEGKYKKRNKAKRTKFVLEVFRPDIVDLMIMARDKLKAIGITKDIYLEKDIKGIGKNYLFDEQRLKAIDAYTFYIQFYILISLKNKISTTLENTSKKIDWNVLQSSSDDKRWEHVMEIFANEFPEKINLKDFLNMLIEMEEKIADDVKKTKAKDDRRGEKIISDYKYAYVHAENDPFVKQTYKELKIIKKEIKEISGRCVNL